MGLAEELVCDDLESYEDVMVRAAVDSAWFGGVRRKLGGVVNAGSLLFDCESWVKKFETGVEIGIARKTESESGDKSKSKSKDEDIYV